jgi:chromosomal replication initiation ATPase DnaA
MAVLIDQLASLCSAAGFRLSPNSSSDEFIDALKITLRWTTEHPASIPLRPAQAVRMAFAALTQIRTAVRFLIITNQIRRDFHLGPDELQSRSREQRIAFARQLSIFLYRRITGAPFESIGAHFRRDHATAIHAYRVIEQRAQRDAAFQLFIQELEGRITKGVPLTVA